MSWTGVITDAGKNVLQSCVAEGTGVNLNLVKTGSSAPDSATAARSLTDVISSVTTGSIVGSTNTDDGVQVAMSFGPYEDSYTMKEVGLFGTVNSSSVLIAYFWNSDGTPIPDVDTFPDFNLALYGILDVADVEELTITPDTSALVSLDALNEALGELGDEKVSIDQGSENAGKFLVVGDDGNVGLLDVGIASGVSF